MATIRLGRYEIEEEGLPAVCMRCGQPATTHKNKTFSWYPSWVPILILAALLAFIIVAAILTKRMRVAVPFCARHRGHWFWRGLLMGLSLLAFVGLFTGLAAWLVGLENDEELKRGTAGGFICFGGIILLLAWIIMAAIVQKTSIQPTEITDNSITLTRISPAFVEAMKAQRRVTERPRSEEYEPQLGERPRPPDTEEFYDPQKLRPRPPESFREGER